jgi:DHA1 family tetracycline resistance protein-like MFS transporter
VLVETIGFGIVLPALPQLMVEMTGRSRSEVTIRAGWLLITYAVLQFVCGPIMGNQSDRFGRRPVLLASLAAIDYALMVFALTLAWLFPWPRDRWRGGRGVFACHGLYRRCHRA